VSTASKSADFLGKPVPTPGENPVSIATGMAISPAAEGELIGRAQRGDAEAFCALASQHHRSLYVLALKYSGNHHDAEDLLQDVMLNAYRAIHQFKGMSSFRTWLARIMMNSFLNQKRKSDPLAPTKRPDAIDEDLEPSFYLKAGSDRNSERMVHNGLVMQQVLALLGSVPERQRLMFLMKHQEGMTCEEIADTMGTSVGTVKKTLFRVVDRLRQHFAVAAVKE
jgi:RNA polymerase sigma-70 factor, ECF subfamily